MAASISWRCKAASSRRTAPRALHCSSSSLVLGCARHDLRVLRVLAVACPFTQLDGFWDLVRRCVRPGDVWHSLTRMTGHAATTSSGSSTAIAQSLVTSTSRTAGPSSARTADEDAPKHGSPTPATAPSSLSRDRPHHRSITGIVLRALDDAVGTSWTGRSRRDADGSGTTAWARPFGLSACPVGLTAIVRDGESAAVIVEDDVRGGGMESARHGSAAH